MPFDSTFDVQSLTAAVNKIPRAPGRIGQLDIFRGAGITSTVATIERREEALTIIPASPRGAPAPNRTRPKREAITLEVPHLIQEQTIVADSIQNVRAFGQDEAETMEAVVRQEIEPLRRNIEATLEWHRLGALRGEVLDADGSTLFNLFDEFGTTPNTMPMGLSTDGTAVRQKLLEAQRASEDELGGMPFSGMRALCGRQFFDALVSHPDVREAFAYSGTGAHLANDPRRGFQFAGVTLEEYPGRKPDGSPFIPDDEAILFPEGVEGLYLSRYAPADFNETVGTVGLPFYAKIAEDPEFGRWTRLHVQSNALHVVTRPRAVLQLSA